MDYAKMLYEYENRFREENELMYKKFIEEFSKYSSFKVEDVITTSPFVFYYDKFWELHSYVLNKSPKDFILFYSILERLGANIKQNLISYIRAISTNIEDELPDYIKDIILRVPIVDGITSDNGVITIHSDKLGDYTFEPIKWHFIDDYMISTVLRHKSLDGECHNVSWDLIKHLYDAKLITMLVPGYFEGTYYHTIIQDKDNSIIDAASGAVFDNDTHKRLVNGDIISVTKEEEMYAKLNESKSDPTLSPSLVLALNNQYNSYLH